MEEMVKQAQQGHQKQLESIAGEKDLALVVTVDTKGRLLQSILRH